MQRGVAGFSVDRKGYHVHWDAIPAWVCTQCGEPLFEAREVDLIQRALVALDARIRTSSLPRSAPASV
jgi:YgiT-type zinc finger domain-containing protein